MPKTRQKQPVRTNNCHALWDGKEIAPCEAVTNCDELYLFWNVLAFDPESVKQTVIGYGCQPTPRTFELLKGFCEALISPVDFFHTVRLYEGLDLSYDESVSRPLISHKIDIPRLSGVFVPNSRAYVHER